MLGCKNGLNIATTQGSRWAGADLVKYQAAEDAFIKEQKENGVEKPLPLVYVLEEEAIKRGEMTRHVCNRSRGFFRVRIPHTPEDDAEFVTFSFHSYSATTPMPRTSAVRCSSSTSS